MRLNRHICTMAMVAFLVQPLPIAMTESSARVQGDVIQLDPAHTVIDFMLPGYLHTTNGRMALKSGSIFINPATGKANGELLVDAASEDSGEALRDAITKHAVLEVDRYPEINHFYHPADPGSPQFARRFLRTIGGSDAVTRWNPPHHDLDSRPSGWGSVHRSLRFSCPVHGVGRRQPERPVAHADRRLDERFR